MLKIGIVGCGFIGRAHSWCLKTLRDAGLVDAAVGACHDLYPARAAELARHHGADVTGLEELVDASDVVWVCTFTSAHLEVVSAAASAGKAVFCEKPLAPTLTAAGQLAGELRRVPHQVGLVLRYAPVFAHAAEIVSSGRYGRVLAAVFRDDQYFPTQGMYGSSWRGDAAHAGGGTLIEHSIHDVDVLRWILGDPVEVAARVSSMFGHTGVDDVAAVTLTYPGGAQASLVSVWHQVLSRPSTRRLEIICERAILWTDDDYLGPLHVVADDCNLTIEGSLPQWVADLRVRDEVRAATARYATQSKAFLDALASGDPGFSDADTALAAHRVVDAAYRSSAAGGVPVGLSGT